MIAQNGQRQSQQARSGGGHLRGAGFGRAGHRISICSCSPAALGLSLSASSNQNWFCTASVATPQKRRNAQRTQASQTSAGRLLPAPLRPSRPQATRSSPCSLGHVQGHLPVLSSPPWSVSFTARNGSRDSSIKLFEKCRFSSLLCRCGCMTGHAVQVNLALLTGILTEMNTRVACPKPGENTILNSQVCTFTPTDTETILCRFSDLL